MRWRAQMFDVRGDKRGGKGKEEEKKDEGVHRRCCGSRDWCQYNTACLGKVRIRTITGTIGNGLDATAQAHAPVQVRAGQGRSGQFSGRANLRYRTAVPYSSGPSWGPLCNGDTALAPRPRPLCGTAVRACTGGAKRRGGLGGEGIGEDGGMGGGNTHR